MKLSTNWYKQKVEQVQNEMANAGLDAILLLDPYNIFYTTGFFHQSTERPLGLLIPQDNQPVFYVPLLEQEMAQDTWIDQIKVYFDYPGKPNSFQWIFGDLNKFKNLGVDQLDYREWELVKAIRPDIALSDLIYNMRLIKDNEEIAIIEKAGIYADMLVAKAKVAIEREMSEREAFSFAQNEVVKQMQAELDELVLVNLGLVNGAILYGERSAFPHGLISERKPKIGDVIQAGFGALVSTYEAESEHVFFYGEPNKQQIEYFNAMYGAWKAGMEAAKPGATCSEVNKAALDVIKKAGFEKYLRHRMGHGKGLQEHEPPWVEAGDHTVLQPGMIISDEPGLYVPGYGGFRHSDTLLITENGCRRLTNYPRDLENCIINIQ